MELIVYLPRIVEIPDDRLGELEEKARARHLIEAMKPVDLSHILFEAFRIGIITPPLNCRFADVSLSGDEPDAYVYKGRRSDALGYADCEVCSGVGMFTCESGHSASLAPQEYTVDCEHCHEGRINLNG